jgi:aminopeptidase-like protein
MAGAAAHLMPPAEAVGAEMYQLIEELYPIRRSLTGEGVRETLRRVARHVPFRIVEVATGTRVYDWVIPKEWNLREAWIADVKGRRIVDLEASTLHVLGYSVPIRGRIAVDDLRRHLFTLPQHPDWIPYRTSYWVEQWGFCVTEKQLGELREPEYEVCIDASLEAGHLTYAEFAVKGETDSEVLISANICHPAQCNDGLSGLALVTVLAKYLPARPLRYSYRFLLSPGTVGPLTWLWSNEDKLPRICHGLVATCVGDSGMMTYKRSRRGDAEIDKVAASVLASLHDDYELRPFVPWGGDERQFCSPGFNLPIGVLTRTPPGEFAEYHSSADDLTCVTADNLGDSFHKYAAVIDVLEQNATYVNRSPKGEPRLGARGLYRTVGGDPSLSTASDERAVLWVLNLSDGGYSLLDIADRSGLPFAAIHGAAKALEAEGLVEEASCER